MNRNLTRRDFLGLCAATVAACLTPNSALAFERDEHDDIIEEALFGRANKSFADSKKSDAKTALECAVYLCLDQMRNDGQTDLDTLREFGVDNLPTLDDIALTHVFVGDHDAYTHMGWHHDYSEVEIEALGEKWNKRWSRRKKLLVDTVNKIYDFGWVDSIRIGALGWFDGTRCDGFAELLYYIHVLGDFQDKIQENIKAGKYRMDLKAIPFAVTEASASNRDFFWDLDEALNLIACEDDAQEEYQKLAQKLDSIATKARRLGTVSTKTSAERFRKNVIETRELLKSELPALLGKVEFFQKVFD